MCGQNVELLDVKPGPVYNNQKLLNINLNYTYTFSSYRAVNTLRLSYKNQSVNAV